MDTSSVSIRDMSWRARLARKNINILGVDDSKDSKGNKGNKDNKDGGRWYYEFMYHPYQGSTKWSKTFFNTHGETDPEVIARELEREVLSLRKELER